MDEEEHLGPTLEEEDEEEADPGAAAVARRASRLSRQSRMSAFSIPSHAGEAEIDRMEAVGRATFLQAQRLRATTKMWGREREQRSLRSNILQGKASRSKWGATPSQLLEEALTDKKVKDQLTRHLGLNKLMENMVEERRRRSSVTYEHPCPWLENIVSTPYFEIGIGSVMCVNGIFIGLQVSSDNPSDGTAVEALEHFFTAFFVAELLLRISVFGWIWMCSIGNFIDVLLVFVSGVLPMWILKPLGVDVANMRMVQTLRTLRLMRIIRQARQEKAFRVPAKLIQGLVNSSRTLFHITLVIGAATYVFGVFAIIFINRSNALRQGSSFELSDQAAWTVARDLSLDIFSTVPRSVFAIFQVMTLDSWAAMVRPFMKFTIGAPVILVGSIVVNNLVLQNLITAVIVGNAMKCAKKDEELQALERRAAIDKGMEDFREIFLDITSDAYLTEEEFEVAVKDNRRLRNKFQIANITDTEWAEVWYLLQDVDDPTDGVNMDRFADVMQQLMGEARAKDSFGISQRLQRLNRRIGIVAQRVAEHKREVVRLRSVCATATKEFAALLIDAQTFIEWAGVCVPGDPVTCKASRLEEKWRNVKAKAVG